MMSKSGATAASERGKGVDATAADAADGYYRNVKQWLLPFFRDGSHAVLDLGCAAGLLGAFLMDHGKAAVVDGVELFEPVARQAAARYRRVHTGDIEVMDLPYGAEFDYVVCGDILEHLKDPYTLMRRIHGWLKPGGAVLVCLPNVRSYRVLKDLLFFGDWKYVPAGILDRTHLRFFTRRSCRRMVEEAGFRVNHERMIVEGPRKLLLNKITFGCFSEFLASQTFVCGVKE